MYFGASNKTSIRPHRGAQMQEGPWKRELMGWWGLHEEDGRTLADSSPNHNHVQMELTTSHRPTWQYDDGLGRTLKFADVNGERLVFANPIKLTVGHSMALWFNRTGANNRDSVIFGRTSSSPRYLTYFSPSGANLNLIYRNDTGTVTVVTGTGAIGTGGDPHFMVTSADYDGTVTIRLDGVQLGSASHTANTVQVESIINYSDQNQRAGFLAISGAAVWNRPMPDDEADWLYENWNEPFHSRRLFPIIFVGATGRTFDGTQTLGGFGQSSNIGVKEQVSSVQTLGAPATVGTIETTSFVTSVQTLGVLNQSASLQTTSNLTGTQTLGTLAQVASFLNSTSMDGTQTLGVFAQSADIALENRVTSVNVLGTLSQQGIMDSLFAVSGNQMLGTIQGDACTDDIYNERLSLMYRLQVWQVTAVNDDAGGALEDGEKAQQLWEHPISLTETIIGASGSQTLGTLAQTSVVAVAEQITGVQTLGVIAQTAGIDTGPNAIQSTQTLAGFSQSGDVEGRRDFSGDQTVGWDTDFLIMHRSAFFQVASAVQSLRLNGTQSLAGFGQASVLSVTSATSLCHVSVSFDVATDLAVDFESDPMG